MPAVRHLSDAMQDHLRRKGFYNLTPAQRREYFLRALRELKGSFRGDPNVATEAFYASKGHGDAGKD